MGTQVCKKILKIEHEIAAAITFPLKEQTSITSYHSFYFPFLVFLYTVLPLLPFLSFPHQHERCSAEVLPRKTTLTDENTKTEYCPNKIITWLYLSSLWMKSLSDHLSESYRAVLFQCAFYKALHSGSNF